MDFLIQFLSTFRPEGFYSLFCGPVLRRLHGHVRPLLLMVGWLVRLSPRHGEPPYQQGIACPAYTVNYLFRLLPVSIKRDRAPGSTARDGMTFRADCRIAESAHALIDALSKAMWIRRRGYRAVPNQGQPHPGEIVLLLLLRKKSQNRKVWNCKLFVNAERLLRQHWASLNGSQKNRFLMRLAGFGVCDGRSVPRTDQQRQGRSSPTPA